MRVSEWHHARTRLNFRPSQRPLPSALFEPSLLATKNRRTKSSGYSQFPLLRFIRKSGGVLATFSKLENKVALTEEFTVGRDVIQG